MWFAFVKGHNVFKVRSFWLRSAQDLANCTKAEQHLLCVQAETSAKYNL